MSKKDRIRANRRNAKKSTGPNTEAGKEVSRGNALQHGYASKVVPHPADAKAVAEGREAFAAAFPSTSPDAKAYFALAALTCAQLERMYEDDLPDLETRQKEAYKAAIEKRREAFRELIQLSDGELYLASNRLEQSPEGVTWKLDAWYFLAFTIEQKLPLTNSLLHRTYALLGYDGNPTRKTIQSTQILSHYIDAGGEEPGGKVRDLESATAQAGRAWLMALVEQEWHRLAALLPEVRRDAEEEAQTAARRARIDTTPRGKTMQRYLTSNGLTLSRTMKEIRRNTEATAAAIAAGEIETKTETETETETKTAAVTPPPTPQPGKNEAAESDASPDESTNLRHVTERSQLPSPPRVEPTPITPETCISNPCVAPIERPETNAS